MEWTEERAAARRENKRLSMADLLARMKEEFPEIHAAAHIVGRWLWVVFEQKPDQGHIDYLKDLGFGWSRRRKAWMHSCGQPHRGKRAPYDPRTKYGDVRVTDEEAA